MLLTPSYSTHVEWAEAFDCPVYLAAEDKQWVARKSEKQVFLDESKTESAIEIWGVDTGIKAIKLGGHFPGSCMCFSLLAAFSHLVSPSTNHSLCTQWSFSMTLAFSSPTHS